MALVGSILILITTIYWFVFRPPFIGSTDLSGGIFSDQCETAVEAVNTLSTTQNFLIGRVISIAYNGNRIYIQIEKQDGGKTSLMIIPRELGDSLAKSFVNSSSNIIRLNYFYLRFCGQPNMYSTNIVVDSVRIGNGYDQITKLVENFKNNDVMVAAYIDGGQNNFIFDRSGVIFAQQLVVLPITQ